MLGVADRAEADRRLGPLLGRLGVKAADTAARRVAAELDAAAVVARMEAAVRSRRVTLRAAVDGMAYLTVLGPMVEVAGAHAALTARARAVVAGHCDDEPHAGPGCRCGGGRHRAGGVVGSLAGSGAAGGGAPGDDRPGPARHRRRGAVGDGAGPGARPRVGAGAGGAVVAAGGRRGVGVAAPAVHLARTGATWSPWTRGVGPSRGCCGGCWCCAMTCAPPRGAAPRSRMPTTRGRRARGAATDYETGNGKCVRCNHVKEAPGWSTTATTAPTTRAHPTSIRAPTAKSTSRARAAPRARRGKRRFLAIRTPLGRTYHSPPPPLLGRGQRTRPPSDGPARRPDRGPRPSTRPGAARRSRLERRAVPLPDVTGHRGRDGADRARN